ncbi:hypothetical protein [Endozoicomonas euniceicola]|uniref:Uncharacterized protein n=1 Tax=Endozoicomonas euniceicola TaxID=1234143 RepID=A0ABY6GV27_9GAMM|nr:hypothetical protein [Endozoicomonas euniceicola]UYM16630.1 hypothetical protein NX720_01470 [Endozoicomonas euniceicola]
MIIDRRNFGIFLFLITLLFLTVTPEGNAYVNSYSVSDSTVLVNTTDTDNTTYEYPARYIVAPNGVQLKGFYLDSEAGFTIGKPLKISLSKKHHDKEPNTALESVIKRLGEVTESIITKRPIPNLILDFNSSGRHINWIFMTSYIFQDTHINAYNLISSSHLRPSEHGEFRFNGDKHYLGYFWIMFYPDSTILWADLVVVYLDQDVYLLIHNKGFEFLDLKGFSKFIEVTLKAGRSWQTATLKNTLSQYVYYLLQSSLLYDTSISKIISFKILGGLSAGLAGIYGMSLLYKDSLAGFITNRKFKKGR